MMSGRSSHSPTPSAARATFVIKKAPSTKKSLTKIPRFLLNLPLQAVWTKPMLRQIITYVLLLNFVNTMFFHELYRPAPLNASRYDQQDLEANETDSLIDLLVDLWQEFSGKAPKKEGKEYADHVSSEKDFLCLWQRPFLAYGSPMAPTLARPLSPFLSSLHSEVIPPPPKPAFLLT
jgi:hypothetical protein